MISVIEHSHLPESSSAYTSSALRDFRVDGFFGLGEAAFDFGLPRGGTRRGCRNCPQFGGRQEPSITRWREADVMNF